MNAASKTHSIHLAILLSAGMLVLACILPLNPSPSAVPSPASTSAPAAAPGKPSAPATSVPGQPTPAGQSAAPQEALVPPDPLDHLLGMRSIKFNLSAARPDGTSSTLDAEIDSAGNMHLVFGHTRPPLQNPPKDLDPKGLPTSSEVYVVGGKAYQPDDETPNWMSQPSDESYATRFSQLLHGPDGPALWLSILPAGSIRPAGDETVGGFACKKYTVDGKVDNQQITGTLWEEPQADALVQAELHVPAALLSPPDKPQSGELKTTLKAQKADVAPVKLPAAPAGATPAASSPNAPAVSNVYKLPHLAFDTGRIAITPGKVWVSGLQGTVDALDPQTGAQLLSVALFQGAGPMSPHPVYDMIFDGQNLWALAGSNNDMLADHLFVISPADGKMLKQFDTADWQNHDDARLGFSPGLVWTESHVIDTSTFEARHVAHPDSPCYGYDGKGWMWIQGTFCEACGYSVWLFNAGNPEVHKYGPQAISSTTAMTTVGERMWIATEQTSGTVTKHVLQVYAADGEKTSGNTQPLLVVPAVDDHPLHLLYDGHALWLLAGGENQGSLFQLDPQSGATLNKLDIPPSVEGDVPWDMAFDGHNLWVLTTMQLVKVSLPWGQ